jgi:hypothetical protein
MTKKHWALIASLIAFFFISSGTLLHFRSWVKGNLYAAYELTRYPILTRSPQAAPSLEPPVEARLVAHAGGAVRGLIYTNTREALDENYAKGYRVFELDFHWTTDNHLVLVHDWTETSSQFATSPHVFNYEEFVGARRRDGLHQLTFEDLRGWLRSHPEALVVTDTKANNLHLLAYLRSNGGDILPQLIIQIYRLSEVQTARHLRPRAVWLTMYKCHYPVWALSRVSGVDAFVIPLALYPNYNDPQLMAKIHFYVHAVPANSAGWTLQHLPGVYGLYVD